MTPFLFERRTNVRSDCIHSLLVLRPHRFQGRCHCTVDVGCPRRLNTTDAAGHTIDAQDAGSAARAEGNSEQVSQGQARRDERRAHGVLQGQQHQPGRRLPADVVPDPRLPGALPGHPGPHPPCHRRWLTAWPGCRSDRSARDHNEVRGDRRSVVQPGVPRSHVRPVAGAVTDQRDDQLWLRHLPCGQSGAGRRPRHCLPVPAFGPHRWCHWLVPAQDDSQPQHWRSRQPDTGHDHEDHAVLPPGLLVHVAGSHRRLLLRVQPVSHWPAVLHHPVDVPRRGLAWRSGPQEP